MTAVRAVCFWAHLTTGVLAGAVILIMCATGAALALKPQIVRTVDRDVRVVDPAGRSPLPLSRLVAGARQSGMPPVTAITVERDPSSTVALSLGSRTVYADPYSGDVLGEPSTRTQAIFRSIESWHRWLAMSGDGRPAGRAVTGASNLAFLGLALSGLYLWWPHAWSPQHTRAILMFRRGATGRARDFNWHNVVGFWCLPLLIVMTATAVVMSYPWANALLYRITGSEVPDAAGRRGGGDSSARQDQFSAAERSEAALLAQLDRAWAEALARVPEWSAMTLRLPPREGAPLTLTISDGAHWNPFARSQLTFDGVSGDVRLWQPYAGTSLGQRARGWVRFGHTGELFGMIGQVLAGIGCLGGVLLVWTGMSLALRRLAAWRGRRASAVLAGSTGVIVSGGERESSS